MAGGNDSGNERRDQVEDEWQHLLVYWEERNNSMHRGRKGDTSQHQLKTHFCECLCRDSHAPFLLINKMVYKQLKLLLPSEDLLDPVVSGKMGCSGTKRESRVVVGVSCPCPTEDRTRCDTYLYESRVTAFSIAGGE